jgi:hypothetical protein
MPVGEWDLDLLTQGKTQFADAACPSFVIADEGDQRVILGCTVDTEGHTVHEAANGALWWVDPAGCWRHDSDLLELNMAGA